MAWLTVAALGALWLGASLLLGLATRLPEKLRNGIGAAFILSGVAGLMLLGRLLGVSTGN